MLRSVAPFWEGNQVWLVAAGGAAFAAFPPVYAALLSGLYPLLIVLLVALILRAVALEFARRAAGAARRAWDLSLGASSLVAVIALGLLFGNVLRGLPLDTRGELVVSLATLFHPSALLATVLMALMVALHGAIWLGCHTEGEIKEHARRWGLGVWAAYLPLLVLAFLLLGLVPTRLAMNYLAQPGLWAVPVLALLAVLVAGAAHAGRRGTVASVASAAAIALVFATSAVGMYPHLIPALGDPSLSLTAHNASASPLALEVLLAVVLLGLPAVIAYTGWLHWLFHEPAADDAD